ncbi:MAG: hypothetical protein IJ464_02880 [Alistipes sp.]|nr:hypothetical protein [Alistipes sp.]
MADIRKIYRYAVKHYTECRNSYLALLVGMFGLPLLMAFLTRSVVGAAAMASSVALFATLYVLYLSTVRMRSKRTFQIDNTLPISAAERYIFIMLNSIVVVGLFVVVVYGASLVLAEMLFPLPPELDFTYRQFLGNGYIIVGLMATHAVLLIVNLTARERVLISYLAAVGLVVVGQFIVGRYVPEAMRADFKLWANVVIVIVGWVSGYFILRSREIKML